MTQLQFYDAAAAPDAHAPPASSPWPWPRTVRIFRKGGAQGGFYAPCLGPPTAPPSTDSSFPDSRFLLVCASVCVQGRRSHAVSVSPPVRTVRAGDRALSTLRAQDLRVGAGALLGDAAGAGCWDDEGEYGARRSDACGQSCATFAPVVGTANSTVVSSVAFPFGNA